MDTALARRQLKARLGARNSRRLDALKGSEALKAADAEPVTVDAADPDGLDRFMHGLDAVISCVGPFVHLCLPVVESAVRTGVAYVDSSGEHHFMEDVYRRFGASGPSAGALVPACGFDYLPGDLSAAVAVRDLEQAGATLKVTIAYRQSGMTLSRGSARTALGMLNEMDLSFRSSQVPFPDGPLSVLEVFWGERITVPRWAPSASVVTGLVMGSGRMTNWLAPAAPALSAMLGIARSASRPLFPFVRRFVDRLPEGPADDVRSRSAFTIVAVASAGSRRTGVVCEGTDIYGLTARFLVEAALRARGAGALTPAQALDPVPFLNAIADGGSAAGVGGPGTFSWRRFNP